MANNFNLQGVGDINITLPAQAATNKILTDPSGGPLHNQSRSFYLGHVDENVNWEGNYSKGSDNLLSLLTYDSNNWISFTLGSVDETNTGAPILYTVTENDTMSFRDIELTLTGISNIAFNITQSPLIKLLYMIKESTNTYGTWFECLRINKGEIKKSQNPTLTSTTDISIYNGLSGTSYNNITVEIQPFRNRNVSFGFSRDNTLDSLITSGYSMTKVADSTFFVSNSVKYENGYFYFSTNNQNSWDFGLGGGGGAQGEGDIIDVSSHYRFSGSNIPLIDIYISNLLNVTIINSFDLHIKCIQQPGNGQATFIKGININVGDSPLDSDFMSWPVVLNREVVFENVSATNLPNLVFNVTKAPGVTETKVSSANIPQGTSISTVTPIKYKISISKLNGIDSISNPIDLIIPGSVPDPDDYNLTFVNVIYGILDQGTNKLYMTQYNNCLNLWTTRTSGALEYIYVLQDSQSQAGITCKLPGNLYRFNPNLGTGLTITIRMIDIDHRGSI